MKEKRFCLGIDTSNYTTSLAIVDETFQVVAQKRKLLYVKPGEKGLRQSQALFEHLGNMPGEVEALMAEAAEKTGLSRKAIACSLCSVAVSEKPRPREDSYMPVFRCGISLGKSLAALLGASYEGVSHQEGHIEAIRRFSPMKDSDEAFLAFHLSGGTTEFLHCTQRPSRGKEEAGYEIRVLGESKDLSVGQVIDRTGVALGLSFPCGEEMDRIAMLHGKKGFSQKESGIAWKRFGRVHTDMLKINLSGIETQVRRYIEENHLQQALSKASEGDFLNPGQTERENARLRFLGEEVVCSVFFRLAECLMQMIRESCQSSGVNRVILAGGVSGSSFIRTYLKDCIAGDQKTDIHLYFGRPEYGSDNAVGTACLGMMRLKGRDGNREENGNETH